ncbi:MAG: guanylate kinase [Proteobacteria bacterium]|nr:guanylate kinase [Pseudomonadota bacterium]
MKTRQPLNLARGTLYIIAAPSGGGKSSLAQALLESMPGVQMSVSYTTRARRHGEVGSVNYYFISPAQFEKMCAAGEFLEHATVFGNRYGTGRGWVEERLSHGIDVILVIDWQGARAIRHLLPESVSIFLLPPSHDALEQRLHARAQDNAEVIAQRMREAVEQISHCDEFDYLVLNDDFSAALADVQAIVRAHRLRREAQAARLKQLLEDLLAPGPRVK